MKTDLTKIDPPTPIVKTPQPPKVSSRGMVIGLMVGILVTLSAVSAVYFYTQNQKLTNQLASTNLSPTVVALPSPTVSANQEGLGTITWLAKPEKVNLSAIFNKSYKTDQESGGGFYPADARYFLVANYANGGKLYDVFLPTDGPGLFDNVIRLISTKADKYSFVERKNYTWDNFKPVFSDQVTLSDYRIRDLEVPEDLVTDFGNFNSIYESTKTFDQLESPKQIAQSSLGPVYVIYQQHKENKEIYSREIYIKLKDSVLASASMSLPFMADDQVPYITWNDSSVNKSQFYSKIASGCGTGFFGPDLIKEGSALIAIKQEAGKTSSGETVYQIKDKNNPLIVELYNSYKVGREYPSAPPIIDIDKYVAANSHFFYKDKLGDWLVFANQEYAAMAECGKPVIYLYPIEETTVNVQVGAKISKSEPEYPVGGWTVLARPDGQLTYQNNNYDYLFWEGKGNGFYPDYKNRGMVVAQKDLVTTLNNQLKQLGLNTQESADFMEFWQSKLPTTNYVRLTWLMTDDMDRLAPLTVNPQPKTKIRIFLEFQGLEKPVDLIPQKLSAVKRNGFTLVEWGGLLIKGQ